MRVVGGGSKGRIIKVPKGIRPTQDKVRALIFDTLGDRVQGTKFIDLFAGSGSVGIEAVSRGASEVVFIEKSKRVAQILKENIKSLGYLDKTKIILRDALKSLNYIGLSDHRTIIFADPPYNKGYIKRLMELFLNFQSSNLSIIIEHSKHEPISIGRHYESGDSIITFILN